MSTTHTTETVPIAEPPDYQIPDDDPDWDALLAAYLPDSDPPF